MGENIGGWSTKKKIFVVGQRITTLVAGCAGRGIFVVSGWSGKNNVSRGNYIGGWSGKILVVGRGNYIGGWLRENISRSLVGEKYWWLVGGKY